MSPARLSMYTAIAFSLPLCVWFLSLISIADGESDIVLQSARQVVQNLALLQLLFLVIFFPRIYLGASWRIALTGVAIYICVPIPILAVAWLIGIGRIDSLILCQASIFCLGLLLILLSAGINRLLKTENVLLVCLAIVQASLVLILWSNRAIFYNWNI